ncbi:MAG: O-antigen ligase family protein [Candidatus Coprovivens sp.]
MNKYKIPTTKFFIIFTFLVLLMPEPLKKIPLLYNLYALFNLVFFIIYMAIFLLKKRKKNIERFELVMILYFIYFLLLSILKNNSSMYNYLIIINQLTLCLVVFVSGENKIKEVIQAIVYITTIYIIINAITLYLFPMGIFSSYTSYGNEVYSWLLGSKNPCSRYIVISLCIRFCYKNYYYNNKYSFFDFIISLISIISIIKLKSTTGLISIGFMIILIIFTQKIKIPQKINYFTIFLLGGLLSYLLIEFNIQNLFKYIIENVFQKNVTLSDRIYIWKQTKYYISQNLIFGYGYETDKIMSYKLLGNHPHNYYLFILYSTGVIGLCLITILFREMSKKCKSTFQTKVGLILFFSLIIMGLTESLTSTPLMYLSFAIIYYLNKNVKEKEGHNCE